MTVIINGTTGVSGVAGSASTPALIGSDADSGYYINSANEPNASVNGTAVWNAASTFGFKNRIINGAMMIDQRNAGASVTPAAGNVYSLDRWQTLVSQNSKFTLQQNAGAVTPPAGYKNYIGITSSSAYSITTGDYFLLGQPIEGFNVSDLAYGSGSAASVTVSFWVRSSLTGTFGGSLNNPAGRFYPFSYTVNSANTWEQKSITISGDTVTALNNTGNGVGIYLWLGFGVGSTLSQSAGSWTSSNGYSTTGATSVVGTNGATWYITGVQLEKGSTATSFDFRSYGTELALCQRYYWQTNSETSYAGIGAGLITSTTSARIAIPYPAPMRASPTVSVTSISSFYINQATDITPTAATPYANSKGCMVDFSIPGTGTLGRGAVLLFANLSTGSIQATAEL